MIPVAPAGACDALSATTPARWYPACELPRPAAGPSLFDSPLRAPAVECADLSIVIPCHNRADLLERCLESVTRHMPRGTELIVVDDASPGAAASQVAARFAGMRMLRLER